MEYIDSILIRKDVKTSYVSKQWAAVKIHRSEISDPPHRNSKSFKTIVCHGNCPSSASWPPIMWPFVLSAFKTQTLFNAALCKVVRKLFYLPLRAFCSHQSCHLHPGTVRSTLSNKILSHLHMYKHSCTYGNGGQVKKSKKKSELCRLHSVD